MGQFKELAIPICFILFFVGIVVGIIGLCIYHSQYGHLACIEEENGKSFKGRKPREIIIY